MFYFVEFLRTARPGDSFSGSPRGCSEYVRDAPRSFVKKTGGQNIKRLLFIKENQTSQVNEFSIFLCMERYTNHSSNAYFSSLGPVPHVFPSCVDPGCTTAGVSTVADGLMAGIPCPS